ncbi:hypothetical protein JXA05_02960 [Candidatus Peregrinibacteria bacterium]|nr:hypothetical protein [Candidatus Peregrinibacteria bacterium]
MIASVATSELVLRALKAARNVEAADRAYFAAEAGIEDALYELAPRFTGYQTPALTEDDVRKTDLFGTAGGPSWENKWAVESRAAPPYTGQLIAKQKLIVSLFNDDSTSNVSANAINAAVLNSNDIVTFNPGNFSVTFRVPFDKDTNNDGINDSYSDVFTSAGSAALTIDNDGDLGYSINGPTGINGLNEDGLLDTSNSCGAGFPPADADCDGRENEDSEEDPVIYWKFSDDKGHSLIPIKGCIDDVAPLPAGGSQLCEKNFNAIPGTLSVTLNGAIEGVNENNTSETVTVFLSRVAPGGANNKLQAEFFTVAPMEQAYEDKDIGIVKKQPIPYFEYSVSSAQDPMPLPYFTIKSDGWYQDFKQSITTTVMPKTSAPLFEFTIIQQQ